MIGRIYGMIGVAVLAVGLLGGCKKKSDRDGADQVPEINVAVAQEDSVVLHKDYPGYLIASSRADVVGEVSGRLLSKSFQAGSYVHKGQVLFTIESTKYRDAVQQAQAQLADARSQRSYSSTQTAALKKAYAKNAVSKMEMLQAENTLHQAEASIKNAEAALENAQTMLSKCTVRAPISGYITKEVIDVGNYVNGEAAPQTLATIYDNSSFDATFSIEDSQYQEMVSRDTPAGEALFRSIPLKFADPMPHTYTADLYYEAPSVSQSTGTLELIGNVKNQDNELKDGMYVTVSLPYGLAPHAVLVKDAALSTDQLGKYLYVVNDSNKVVYTPVTVGQLYQDTLRVIEKGIKPGEKYVTEALLTVRNGMTVKPKIQK